MSRKSANVRSISLHIAMLFLLMGAIACGEDDISRELGARCEQKKDCSELCLVGQKFPAGFCSTSCFDNEDCGGQSVCAKLNDLGVCMFPCIESDACEFMGEGWTCVEATLEMSEETIDVCMGATP